MPHRRNGNLIRRNGSDFFGDFFGIEMFGGIEIFTGTSIAHQAHSPVPRIPSGKNTVEYTRKKE